MKYSTLLVRKFLYSQFWNSDTSPVQFMIGVAGILWSILLFWPGNTFERQPYAVMSQMLSEHAWAVNFAIHGVLMIVASTRLTYWPFYVNLCVSIFGCVLWTSTALAMMLSIYPLPMPAAIAGEIALAFGAWWVLVRTEHRKPNGL